MDKAMITNKVAYVDPGFAVDDSFGKMPYDNTQKSNNENLYIGISIAICIIIGIVLGILVSKKSATK